MKKETETEISSIVLILFDYDWSLINANSDTFVIEVLANDLNNNFKEYRNEGLGWTAIMDRQMGHLHDRGILPADIEACVAAVPVQEGMLEALHLAAENGAVMHIISDANEVFIRSFLEHHGLTELFAGVHTNLAEFSEEGRLRVRPYHDNTWCPLCPVNMCKGSIVQSILAQSEHPISKIIYIGDGGGDYCPATVLREHDLLLARNSSSKQYGLMRKILQIKEENKKAEEENCNNQCKPTICADIIQWAQGIEVLNIFQNIFELPSSLEK